MAIEFGAQTVNTDYGTSATTHTATLTLEAGDLVVVGIGSRDGATAVSSVHDSVNGAGSPYTEVLQRYWVANGIRAALYFFQNSAAGSATITVTHGSAARCGFNVSRWTGAHLTSALDQSNGADNTSTTGPHSHGSITTTGAGLMVTASQQGTSGSVETPNAFTALTASGSAREYLQYLIVTGSTTDDGDYSTDVSVTSTGVIASFNQASGGSPITDGPALVSVRGNIRFN